MQRESLSVQVLSRICKKTKISSLNKESFHFSLKSQQNKYIKIKNIFL